MQKLHEKHADKGLAILGFPCDRLFGQEPGSAAEIREFCRVNYGVTFDMFAKVDVNGDDACELYRFLTSLDTKPKGAGKIGWNFEKFVIDRNGIVLARFGSATKPDAPELVAVIERELAREAPIVDSNASQGQDQGQELNLAYHRRKSRLVLRFAHSADEKIFHDFWCSWNARDREVSNRDIILVGVTREALQFPR